MPMPLCMPNVYKPYAAALSAVAAIRAITSFLSFMWGSVSAVKDGHGHVVCHRNQVVELRPDASYFHVESKPVHLGVQGHAASLQHGGQRAAAASVGCQCSLCSLDRQGDQDAVVATQSIPAALPSLEHRRDLGKVLPCGFFALGAHLLNGGQLGSQVAVLTALMIPLQGNGDIDRDHLGIAGPTLTEHQLHTPVG